MSAIPLRKLEGKYDILEKFREGGMGAIYKVRHRLLDEVRVIKVMRPQFVEDEELKDRFLREARLAIRLRHPNIAQLYDFTVDDDDGTAYIVMEFIHGMNLEDLLKSMGPPPLGLALEIAQQSLRALGYLHDKGMIHRDISPDNLMLTEDIDGNPLIKLIDLGIAKALTGGEGKGTATGIFLGKVRYSSPEQFGFEGSEPMDARGDLYSFGIVLYELLTGRYPIQGRDPSSLIAGHLFRPPLDFAESDPQGRVPPAVRQLILAALAKRPGDRPQSAQELSRALGSLRRPSDFTREDLERTLSRRSQGPAGASPPGATTTTQDRLDRQFDLTRTPSPQQLAASPEARTVPRVVVPLRPADEEIRGHAAAIERLLDEGAAAAAERDLRWAVDTYGEQPELAGLRLRLEEVREAERQRAELAAATAAIDEALERGDYRGAETLLFAAEAAFGPQEAFPPRYEQVAELHRRDHAAKAAALVESARRLADAGSFEEAREALRRAQGLDPDGTAAAAALAGVDEAEAGAKRREKQERRARKLAAAAAKIQEQLDAGDLGRAGELLDRSVAAFGAAEVLRAKWERLEELRHGAGGPAAVPPADR